MFSRSQYHKPNKNANDDVNRELRHTNQTAKADETKYGAN